MALSISEAIVEIGKRFGTSYRTGSLTVGRGWTDEGEECVVIQAMQPLANEIEELASNDFCGTPFSVSVIGKEVGPRAEYRTLLAGARSREGCRV